MNMMTVRRSRIYIAAAAALFAAAAAVFLLMRGLIRFIAAAALLLVALGCLLFWLLCTVCYSKAEQKEFTVKTLFGKRRTVAYSDLWGIRNNRLFLPKSSILLAKGKRTEQFLEYANRRYQSAHGKRIPNIVKIKRSHDPMNDNVYEPWSFIIVVGLIFFGSLCMLIYVIVSQALHSVLAIVVFGVGTLFSGFTLVMLIYVGRNADILPRWLVELFYRPDALTFQTDQYQGKKLK